MLIHGAHHLELYVGDAPQTVHYLRTVCGFALVDYPWPVDERDDHRSFHLHQGGIRLQVTAGLDPQSEAVEHVRNHGSGVKDIAFEVADVHEAFVAALRCGARPVVPPNGRRAVVGVLGDLTHSLIKRPVDDIPEQAPDRLNAAGAVPVGLRAVDHVAICVPQGRLDDTVRFYAEAFGFVRLHEELVATPFSAMRSIAVQNETGSVKLVFVEPAEVAGGGRGQIADFLANHGGPGVQHVAFLVEDIVASSHALRRNGVEFLDIPDEYYEGLPQRVGAISEDLAALRGAGVLADRDEWGYLLQQFSKPILTRDTLFLEIIQRHCARGFGSGNIRALFEAVERRQRANASMARTWAA